MVMIFTVYMFICFIFVECLVCLKTILKLSRNFKVCLRGITKVYSKLINSQSESRDLTSRNNSNARQIHYT